MTLSLLIRDIGLVPKLFDWNGYRFFFFSNEGAPIEPCHVHVRQAEKSAKIWIRPEIKIAESFGFNSKELRAIMEKVVSETNLIEEKWNGYFNL